MICYRFTMGAVCLQEDGLSVFETDTGFDEPLATTTGDSQPHGSEDGHPEALAELGSAIQLKPGIPWWSTSELNRLLRQQGLCLAVAQAAVFDEIAQATTLDREDEDSLIHHFLTSKGITTDDALALWLEQKAWSQEDLRYFATKFERLTRFKLQHFSDDLEAAFLERKLDLDQVVYSLIRVPEQTVALELYQRILEGEADFASLASEFSQGSERLTGGRIGPVSLDQAHPEVSNKLRISQPGQLWPPFFLVDIWLILRLDQVDRAALTEATRAELREARFNAWLDQRVTQLLAGEVPAPLSIPADA